MRSSVVAVLALGKLPDESFEDMEVWRQFERALAALPKHCLDDEAVALLDSFPEGEDSAYGMAWTLLHFIETAPGWPMPSELDDRSPWVELLRRRDEMGSKPGDHRKPPSR